MRYFGYIFVVLMAVALATGVTVLLVGNLAERLSMAPMLGLTVSDQVATSSPRILLMRGVLRNVRYGGRVAGGPVYFRFADGWSGVSPTGARGVAYAVRRGIVPDGRYDYEAHLTELSPHLGVRGRGTVWVGIPEKAVVWVDTAGVLVEEGRPGGPGGRREGPWPEAADALQVLARSHQLVYLVVAEPAEYEDVRRRLGASDLPEAPAIWIDLGAEGYTLKRLRDFWPRVRAALVATAALEAPVRSRRVEVWPVAEAGGWATGDRKVMPWSEVVDRLAPAGEAAEERAGL